MCVCAGIRRENRVKTDARPSDLGQAGRVSVSLRLTGAQIATAERLAGKSGIRFQTLLKRLIADGLRSMDEGLRSLERAARLKNWQ